jgi:hypothetical protein
VRLRLLGQERCLLAGLLLPRALIMAARRCRRCAFSMRGAAVILAVSHSPGEPDERLAARLGASARTVREARVELARCA